MADTIIDIPNDIIDNPCIICLETNDTVDINNLRPCITLIKTCACKFYTHEKCIVKWITNNPTCPYCKQLLCFECCIVVSSTNGVLGTNGVSDANEISIIEARNNNGICIARCILMFIIIIILIIIFNKIFLT